MRPRFLYAGLAATVMVLVGCSGKKASETHAERPRDSMTARPIDPAVRPAAMTTVNSVCPFSSEEFNPRNRSATESRTWKGVAIGFCCPDCVMVFDSRSDDEKDAVLALAKQNQAQ